MRRLTWTAATLIAVTCASTARAQLMQYWTFDGDFTNSVDGGLAGTVMGTGVSIGTGADEYRVGAGAMKIAHDTPSGDYFHVEGAVIPDYNPCAFTVTTWYKFDDTLGTQPTDARNFLFETFPTWTAGAGLRDDGTGNRDIECYFQGATTSVYEDAGPIVNDGQWHHLAMVYDHAEGVNGSINLYFDGILTSILSSVTLAQPIAGMNIGNHRAGDGGRNWKGYIDDFAVYNGTIDDAGVMGLYFGTYTPETVPVTPGPDAPPPLPSNPLQAYWTFDTDYSSAVNNDYYQGIPHGGEFTSITNVPGEFKNGTGALKLDSGPSAGNRTFVEIPTEVADVGRDKQITVSAWYNYTDISGDGSDTRSFVWESSPGYSLSFGLRDDGAGTRDAEWWFEGLASDTSGPIITSGEWNHAVMVLDMDVGRAQFYHNGELRDDVPVSESIPGMTGLNIGNHRAGNGERDFDGFIDDVAVFHGVLTAEAVAGLFEGTYTPLNVPVSDSLAQFPSAEVVEAGWKLAREIDFQNPQGVFFDEVTGQLFVGRRQRGAEDGIYEITADGSANSVFAADRPAAIVGVDGQLFVSFDYPGTVRKYDLTAETDELWVSEWDNPIDDDTVGMCVVPEGYAGPDFGGLVTVGRILAVDRGSGGYEEVWVFSTDTPEGEMTIVADSDVADGVGSVFVDPADIAISSNRIFVADPGANSIFEITAIDTVVELALNETIDGPRSLVTDPLTNDLFVLTSDSRVVRVDITTGDVGTMIENIGGVVENSGWWDCLEVSADGKRLFLLDFALDRVYEFVLETADGIPGDLNGDGFVGSADLDIVRSNWGQAVSGAAQGDPSGDGIVGSADLDIVRANWGSGTPAAVPEPGTVLLMLTGIVAACFRRPTRREC